MQPKEKSNSVVTSSWDLLTGIITFTVIGAAAGKLVFNAAEVAGSEAYKALTDNGKRALVHGFTQRISDRAAIGRDKTTGTSASPADKFAAMKALAEHYASGGTWELAGGGLPPVDRASLYQAVAIVRKIDAQKVEATYRDKTDEVLRTLLGIADVAAEYTRIRRASMPVNKEAEALMAELERMGLIEELAALAGTSKESVTAAFEKSTNAEIQAEIEKLKAA